MIFSRHSRNSSSTFLNVLLFAQCDTSQGLSSQATVDVLVVRNEECQVPLTSVKGRPTVRGIGDGAEEAPRYPESRWGSVSFPVRKLYRGTGEDMPLTADSKVGVGRREAISVAARPQGLGAPVRGGPEAGRRIVSPLRPSCTLKPKAGSRSGRQGPRPSPTRTARASGRRGAPAGRPPTGPCASGPPTAAGMSASRHRRRAPR